MSRTDLIADAFTMVRNAVMAKKPNLDIPASKTVKSVLEIFKREGYIDNFKALEDSSRGEIRVYLKYYSSGKSAIREIIRVSKPGLRKYVGKEKIPHVLRGKGVAIVTTSKGIITGEEARSLGVGGEVIGYIW